jgi:hypothetical protein
MAATILTLRGAALSLGNTATLTVAPETLIDQAHYKLRYLVTWTGATGLELLQVQVGESSTQPLPITYPVWDQNGVAVTIGQFRECVRRREYLKLVFVAAVPAVGTVPAIPAHFVVVNCLFPQAIVIPPTTVLAVPSGSTVAAYTSNGKLVTTV